MRVIEITGEPILHGGQERFLSNLIKNIDNNNLIIDVLTPYSSNNIAFESLVTAKGGHMYSLGLNFMPGKSRNLLFKPLKQFLIENHYDVAHIHSGSISALAYLAKAAQQSHVNKVIVHSHASGISTLKHKIIRFAFGFTLKSNATDFLACSYEAGVMKYPGEVVRKNLIVIKNGIDVDKFRFRQSTREKIRAQLGINNSSFVIGHVGRFTVEKNHKFLIDLYADVLQQIPQSVLLLVGDGELREEIKEEVHSRQISQSVIFTGNVDDVQDYYSAMNVFVLPSLYEGFSYVTLEAQATGIPCIISTGVPETVVIGENVERLELRNKPAWIARIVSMYGKEPVDNSIAIKQFGYDVKQSTNQIREIYLK